MKSEMSCSRVDTGPAIFASSPHLNHTSLHKLQIVFDNYEDNLEKKKKIFAFKGHFSTDNSPHFPEKNKTFFDFQFFPHFADKCGTGQSRNASVSSDFKDDTPDSKDSGYLTLDDLLEHFNLPSKEISVKWGGWQGREKRRCGEETQAQKCKYERMRPEGGYDDYFFDLSENSRTYNENENTLDKKVAEDLAKKPCEMTSNDASCDTFNPSDHLSKLINNFKHSWKESGTTFKRKNCYSLDDIEDLDSQDFDKEANTKAKQLNGEKSCGNNDERDDNRAKQENSQNKTENILRFSKPAVNLIETRKNICERKNMGYDDEWDKDGLLFIDCDDELDDEVFLTDEALQNNEDNEGYEVAEEESFEEDHTADEEEEGEILIQPSFHNVSNKISLNDNSKFKYIKIKVTTKTSDNKALFASYDEESNQGSNETKTRQNKVSPQTVEKTNVEKESCKVEREATESEDKHEYKQISYRTSPQEQKLIKFENSKSYAIMVLPNKELTANKKIKNLKIQNKDGNHVASHHDTYGPIEQKLQNKNDGLYSCVNNKKLNSKKEASFENGREAISSPFADLQAYRQVIKGVNDNSYNYIDEDISACNNSCLQDNGRNLCANDFLGSKSTSKALNIEKNAKIFNDENENDDDFYHEFINKSVIEKNGEQIACDAGTGDGKEGIYMSYEEVLREAEQIGIKLYKNLNGGLERREQIQKECEIMRAKRTETIERKSILLSGVKKEKEKKKEKVSFIFPCKESYTHLTRKTENEFDKFAANDEIMPVENFNHLLVEKLKKLETQNHEENAMNRSHCGQHGIVLGGQVNGGGKVVSIEDSEGRIGSGVQKYANLQTSRHRDTNFNNASEENRFFNLKKYFQMKKIKENLGLELKNENFRGLADKKKMKKCHQCEEKLNSAHNKHNHFTGENKKNQIFCDEKFPGTEKTTHNTNDIQTLFCKTNNDVTKRFLHQVNNNAICRRLERDFQTMKNKKNTELENNKNEKNFIQKMNFLQNKNFNFQNKKISNIVSFSRGNTKHSIKNETNTFKRTASSESRKAPFTQCSSQQPTNRPRNDMVRSVGGKSERNTDVNHNRMLHANIETCSKSSNLDDVGEDATVFELPLHVVSLLQNKGDSSIISTVL